MNCPFCAIDRLNPVLENQLAFAIYDLYPQSPGHLLVVLRRHVPDYFAATPAEHAAIAELLGEGKQLLDRERSPAGYTVLSNVGAIAGQVVMHCHIHLIPRY